MMPNMFKKFPKPQNSLGSIFCDMVWQMQSFAEAEVEKLPNMFDCIH